MGVDWQARYQSSVDYHQDYVNHQKRQNLDGSKQNASGPKGEKKYPARAARLKSAVSTTKEKPMLEKSCIYQWCIYQWWFPGDLMFSHK